MSVPQPTEFKTIDVICNLIREQMDLAPEHVLVYNQKFRIPTQANLFVVVAFSGTKTLGTSSRCADDDAGTYTEYQSTNVQETYRVSLYSRTEEALSRQHEIVLALTGVLAQQAQETYHFNIAQNPVNIVDVSEVEASARLFRVDITFQTQRFLMKMRPIHYFGQFSIPPQIHTNQ